MKTTYTTFDAAEYLDNDAVIAEYLSAAAEDANPDVFIGALGDVAKARGMAQIAEEAGLGRESLYKALSTGAHPRLETVSAVLRALGLKLSIVPKPRQFKTDSSKSLVQFFRESPMVGVDLDLSRGEERCASCRKKISRCARPKLKSRISAARRK